MLLTTTASIMGVSVWPAALADSPYTPWMKSGMYVAPEIMMIPYRNPILGWP
jgi:hypothetical protein